MFDHLIAAAAIGGLLVTQAASPERSGHDEWQALRFLIGSWDARVTGGAAGAAAAGQYAFPARSSQSADDQSYLEWSGGSLGDAKH